MYKKIVFDAPRPHTDLACEHACPGELYVLALALIKVGEIESCTSRPRDYNPQPTWCFEGVDIMGLSKKVGKKQKIIDPTG